MNNPIVIAFTRSDSPPMVAAALRILSTIAADPAQRHDVAAPWAWDLRQRARAFERAGQRTAGRQAKVIARLVGAVALGEVSSDELSNAANTLGADEAEACAARAVLESVMTGTSY